MIRLSYLGTWYLNGGHVAGPQPRSAHPSLTPSQLYRTKDGWMFIMCKKEKFWPLLCEAIGRPEWMVDPDFATSRRGSRTGRASRANSTKCSDEDNREWLRLLAGTSRGAGL